MPGRSAARAVILAAAMLLALPMAASADPVP